MEDNGVEQLQRQVDEIEALRAMFPDYEDGGGGGGAGGPLGGELAALVLDPVERQALVLTQQVCEAAALGPGSSGGGSLEGSLKGLPLLSGTVRPPGLQYGGQTVALRFTLPRGYPGGGGDGGSRAGGAGSGGAAGAAGADGPLDPNPPYPPHLHHQALLAVECGGPRSVHERLSEAVRAVAEREAEAGCECLLLALDALKDAVEELAALHQQDMEEGARPEFGAGDAGARSVGAGDCSGGEAASEGLLCVLVWLHHLKSLTKRKLIVQWTRELGLAGACKPGFPGVVVVEGHSADVREFLGRMRALTWQAMQVRGQDLMVLSQKQQNQLQPDQQPVRRGAADSGDTPGESSSAGKWPQAPSCAASRNHEALIETFRRLRSPLPFVELEESGMSQLGGLCKAAGLHHVFLTALKL